MIEEKDRVMIFGSTTGRVEVPLWFRYLSSGIFFIGFFERYLQAYIGNYAKYYILLMVFSTLIIIWQNRQKIMIKSIHIGILCWFFFYLFSLLWGDFMAQEVEDQILTLAGMTLLLFILTTVSFPRKFVMTLVNAYFYSSALFGLLSLWYAEPYVLEYAQEDRLVLTLYGIQNDPNNIGAILMFGIWIGVYRLLMTRKNYLLNTLVIGINLFSCLQTASRGAFVSLGAIGFLWGGIILERYNWKQKIIFLTSSTLILMGLSSILPEYLDLKVYERLFVNDYGGGSDRDILWAFAWRQFCSSPVWGCGWGNVIGCDNTYLTLLAQGGVIGISLFLIPYFWLGWRSWRSQKYLIILLLFVTLIPAFFFGAINKRFFWYGLILCWMLFYCHDDETKK